MTKHLNLFRFISQKVERLFREEGDNKAVRPHEVLFKILSLLSCTPAPCTGERPSGGARRPPAPIRVLQPSTRGRSVQAFLRGRHPGGHHLLQVRAGLRDKLPSSSLAPSLARQLQVLERVRARSSATNSSN